MAKWDPFKDLTELRERMNHLFETSLTRERELAAGLQAGAWSPTADVYETEQGMVIRAELAGVRQDDFEVRFDGDHLVLRGERRMGEARTGASISRLEREYGRFQRVFPLPDWASRDSQAVKADFTDGVLEVMVPRQNEEDSARVQVSSS
jgi:HSP20 family protein